jgi:hypothetical protein
MTRSAYRINAALCVLVIVHAVYRFVARSELVTNLWIGLVVAEAILGLIGAVWFWNRSRGASA